MSETVRKRGLVGYVLLAPALVWLALFFLIPFYSLVATSLFNKGGSDFRGYSMVYQWSNFTDALKTYGKPTSWATRGRCCGRWSTAPSRPCCVW